MTSLLSQRLACGPWSEARVQYAQGVGGNYLQVLNAQRSVQQAEQSLLSARRQLLSQRIQLHRALGGTWTQELTPPEEPE